MPLPYQGEESIMQHKRSTKSVGEVLSLVLTRARDEDRLTCGVSGCASHLETMPETVMLCLLPETTPYDIQMSIHHKLIEAFCLENDIVVAKINNCDKFVELLSKKAAQQKSANDNPVTSPSPDCSCVLIDWPPKEKTNKHENRLMEQIWPNQTIELPV